MHCKIRHFTESKNLMITRVFQQNRREAASGEIRVKGSLASESRLFRDERPKVGFGRSGQSNKLAPVPEFAQVGELGTHRTSTFAQAT